MWKWLKAFFKSSPKPCSYHTWAWYDDGIGLYCSVCGRSTLEIRS